jgi:hypothetical protein
MSCLNDWPHALYRISTVCLFSIAIVGQLFVCNLSGHLGLCNSFSEGSMSFDLCISYWMREDLELVPSLAFTNLQVVRISCTNDLIYVCRRHDVFPQFLMGCWLLNLCCRWQGAHLSSLIIPLLIVTGADKLVGWVVGYIGSIQN